MSGIPTHPPIANFEFRIPNSTLGWWESSIFILCSSIEREHPSTPPTLSTPGGWAVGSTRSTLSTPGGWAVRSTLSTPSTPGGWGQKTARRWEGSSPAGPSESATVPIDVCDLYQSSSPGISGPPGSPSWGTVIGWDLASTAPVSHKHTPSRSPSAFRRYPL